MTPRIVANIATFVVMAIALAWWATTNYVTFGLTQPPANVVAMDFEASPGLQPGFEVAYLGHGVGRVAHVALADHHVVVTTELDPDQPIPATVEAAVRRRSAVGEPYVDLTPAGAATTEPPTLLADGDHIGLDRTSVPLSYEAVFRSVADLLDAIPEGAVGTILGELATGLDGRGDDLRAIILDVESVLTTFAERADVLDHLAVQATDLAASVADRSGTLRDALDDAEVLAAAIRESRTDLLRLIEASPDLLERVSDLAAASRPHVSCLLGALERSVAAIDTPANTAALRAAVADAPEVLALLDGVVHARESGSWLRVEAMINDGGPDPLVEYAEPLPYPEVPVAVDCTPDDATQGGAGLASGSAGQPAPVVPPALGADSGDVRPDADSTPAPDAAPDSTERQFARDQPDLWWFGLALGLVAVLVARPWRLLGRLARGQGRL